MRRIAIFCSNPVNGGTAEVFVSLCEELVCREKIDYEIYPCINICNKVSVFNRINNIERLSVYSYEDTYGSYKEEYSIIQKIWRKLFYLRIKKKNVEEMKRFLYKNRIDSVVIHNGGYLGDDLCNQMLKAAYKAKIHGERIVVFHSECAGGWLRRIRNIPYDYMIKKQATKVVTVSNYTKYCIEKKSFVRNIFVVNNGINLLSDSIISNDKIGKVINYKGDAVNFVQIGNFFSLKGQKYLIEAFSIAKNATNKNIRLTIIGNVYDEEYFDECKGLLKRIGIEDHVTILHNLYNARNFLSYYDTFVFSSVESESMPIVLLEAMSASLPIIAFDCGGTREVIHDGEDGFIIEKRDVQRMANAMVMLAEDDTLRKQMGRTAFEHYENQFTRRKMGDRYLELL